MTINRQNCAGNIDFASTHFHQPQTMAELCDIVHRADKVRVLGAGHSFNAIADTPGDMVNLDCLDIEPTIDRKRGTVTASGGMRYGHLGEFLHENGYALHNMASLPRITLAGACATATHGSGDGNGNLATAVAAIEFVAADGEVVMLARGDEGFAGAVVNLGGLGVVIKMTLDLQPTFEMQQAVYENLPLAQVDAHFNEIMSSGYSVSLFTDWQHEHVNRVWVKQRVDEEPAVVSGEFFQAALVKEKRRLITSRLGDGYTHVGVAGPWFERLPHFRMDYDMSVGNELQTEYFVARRDAIAAIHAVAALRREIAPLLIISEVRTVAADALWLSPAYGQDIVGLHFTWHKNVDGVQRFLPLLEDCLAPFAPRPHWGKLFALSPAAVQRLYERLGEFRSLLERYDPSGKFRNAFLDKYTHRSNDFQKG